MSLRKIILLSAFCAGWLASVVQAAEAPPVRLFILSGQSNMAGMDPEASFIPAIKAAYPNDDLVFIKVAQSGRPIRDWLKDWVSGTGDPIDARRNGRRYEEILAQVKEKLAGKEKPKSVAFVWMQGEADSKGYADVYEKSLGQLHANLKRDLQHEDVVFVLGRISDYKETSPDPNKAKPDWDKIRAAQMQFVEKNPRAAWIDTDDLNGTKDGLHYTRDGYRLLGERFAAKTVELLNARP